MVRKKKRINSKKREEVGNSLAVQWLRLTTFTADGAGSIPGWGTKILQATHCSQKKKKKKRGREQEN